MISARFKRLLSQILPIGLIWLLTGWVFLWTEYAIIGAQQNTPATAITITPKIIVFASLSIILVGFFVGVIEFTFINKRFQSYSFLVKLIGKFLFYVLLMEFVILVTYMVAASIELETTIFSFAIWDKYQLFFFSITHVSTMIQLGFSLMLTLFYVEISENLGHSVLVNFFMGRYHKPQSETRLFMFSDMKSSTQIAETLGHYTYFEFLKCYYNDLSDAILKHQGEVYQYVGDEIVISWQQKTKGFAQLSLKCFFEMKQHLEQRKTYYMECFGVCPDFKASLHIGEVTTGEIGALKKAIFFTGDVLNTTARMQAECTTYNVDLIVSKAVVDLIPNSERYVFKSLGKAVLRGKSETLELFTVG
ncbi:adenylate/guanylate cyclase domain-containing protein [Winogradskyella pulchriflava]|uniref:Adenylate/guanylate cyclase domain-containing protein n=1 Tax=Winogradskyella pulchriflava TaxID=1110688 RepID=A0ABV6Q9M2_9FLAO